MFYIYNLVVFCALEKFLRAQNTTNFKVQLIHHHSNNMLKTTTAITARTENNAVWGHSYSRLDFYMHINGATGERRREGGKILLLSVSEM